MSIKISEVFGGLTSQQLPALVTILTKAEAHAGESATEHKSMLAKRLHEDMHPLSWQIQTVLELVLRGIDRLLEKEPTSLVLDEDDFGALIARIESIQAELSNLDTAALDQAADKTFELPVGPDAVLSLTGKDYVLKFLLPNVYFHFTTAYDLLRMQGVPVGKRDYMGPF